MHEDDVARKHAIQYLIATTPAGAKIGIIGMDYDPFLAANGKFDGYYFDSARVQGTSCRVPLHLKWAGRTDTVPDAVPQLVLMGARWRIDDVLYPHFKGDVRLTTELKALRAEYQAAECRN